MTPGEYEVIAMADGYEPLAKLIEVSEHGHSGTNTFFRVLSTGPSGLGVLKHTGSLWLDLFQNSRNIAFAKI